MNRRDHLVSGTIGVLLGSGVGLVGALGTRIVMARILGPAGLGLLTFGIAVVSSLGLVASAGVLNASARRIAERLHSSGDGAGPTARTGLALAATTGTITAGVVFLLHAPLARLLNRPELAEILMVLAPVALGLTVGTSVWGMAQGFDEVRGRALIRDAGGGLLRLAGVAAAALFYGSVLSLAIGWVVGSLLAEASFLAHGAKRGWMSGGSRTWDPRLIGTLPPFMGQSVLGQIRVWADLLILGVLYPPASVGLYTAARGLAQMPGLIWLSAMHRFLPQATRAVTSGDTTELGELLAFTRKLVFSMMWPFLAVSLMAPRTVLTTLFGGRFATADVILLVLAASLVVEAVGGYLELTLIAADRARTALSINAFNLALATTLMVPLGLWLAGLGIALAILVGRAASTAAFAWAVRRHGVSAGLPGFLRWALAACTPAVVCGTGLAFVDLSPVAELVAVFAAALPPLALQLLPHGLNLLNREAR